MQLCCFSCDIQRADSLQHHSRGRAGSDFVLHPVLTTDPRGTVDTPNKGSNLFASCVRRPQIKILLGLGTTCASSGLVDRTGYTQIDRQHTFIYPSLTHFRHVTSPLRFSGVVVFWNDDLQVGERG